METKLTINQEVLITIKTIGINGEGIGFYKRQAVFVDGVMPPEEVVVRIKSLHKGYAVAEAKQIKKKAFYRRRPFCKHYGVCGGCQLQHVDYEEQQRLKEDLLKQSFKRYTSLPLSSIKFHPFNPIVKPRHYRYKAQMPVKNTDQGVVTGLFKKNTQDLVEVLDCPVQNESINLTNQRVLEICDRYDIRAFDETTMRGMLRHVVTRRSQATGEIQVTLVITIFNKALFKAAKDILELPDVVSVAISKNHDVKNREVFGETFEVLAGKESIEERLGDIRYALNPKAFFQLNPQEAQNMYEYIRTLFDTAKERTLLDLYTGSGAMALYFGNMFERVIGVDFDEASIRSAKENAKRNRMNHVEFLQDDAVQFVTNMQKEGQNVDVAVFDPPRTGLDERMIRSLVSNPIPKLIYVSCNPSTLAKNIDKLSGRYRVKSVMPFDMFPQTSHVESVTLLEQKT